MEAMTKEGARTLLLESEKEHTELVAGKGSHLLPESFLAHLDDVTSSEEHHPLHFGASVLSGAQLHLSRITVVDCEGNEFSGVLDLAARPPVLDARTKTEKETEQLAAALANPVELRVDVITATNWPLPLPKEMENRHIFRNSCEIDVAPCVALDDHLAQLEGQFVLLTSSIHSSGESSIPKLGTSIGRVVRGKGGNFFLEDKAGEEQPIAARKGEVVESIQLLHRHDQDRNKGYFDCEQSFPPGSTVEVKVNKRIETDRRGKGTEVGGQAQFTVIRYLDQIGIESRKLERYVVLTPLHGSGKMLFALSTNDLQKLSEKPLTTPEFNESKYLKTRTKNDLQDGAKIEGTFDTFFDSSILTREKYWIHGPIVWQRASEVSNS